MGEDCTNSRFVFVLFFCFVNVFFVMGGEARKSGKGTYLEVRRGQCYSFTITDVTPISPTLLYDHPDILIRLHYSLARRINLEKN